MSKIPAVDVRPIGLDNLGELRRVHTLAYRAYLGSDLSEDQIEALVDYVRTPDYTELLLSTECLGAWIENRLCATASWMPGGTAGASAKIIGVCVDPLFGGLGLARNLVNEVEARARRAGFAVITARSPLTMVPFFERLGYGGSSRGVWATPCGVTIPVVHMRKGEAKSAVLAGRRLPATQRAARLAGLTRIH